MNTAELLIRAQQSLAKLGETMCNGCTPETAALAREHMKFATTLVHAVDRERRETEERARHAEYERARLAA
ncbi:TPA: hypothetical protein QDA99_006634 [Burkholderia vietnamiensis]|uniref:hypothetical protein n=1 Tax=Burkholderia vietnamiensis TaxID=60552 RepID=UPI00158E7B87|nr:hypothetical protein [Burkholderia vietnamiensis]HDR9003004.1 hypothetical protein [Burkholderia vietnamiensis]HDR9006952.1 hypothetical protein [Burkholderia vietnamiensis]